MYSELFSGLYKSKVNREKLFREFYSNNKVKILSELPFATAQLVAELNSYEFIEFIYKNGSKKIYVTDQSRLESSLSLKINNDFNKIVLLTDSSGYIEIPSRWGIYSLFRKIALEKAFMEGADTKALIKYFGVSRRTISNLNRRFPHVKMLNL